MKTAIVVYDKFYMKSLGEICEILASLGREFRICGFKDEVKDNFGTVIKPAIFGESLDGFECIIVCDGETKSVIYDDIWLGWLRSSVNAKTKIAISSAKILLQTAGFASFIATQNLKDEI